METPEVAAALRRIARGFDDLADAISRDPERSQEQRIAGVLSEWGDRGLTRGQTSALLRKHGFAPQTAGGWARGDWISSRNELRYVSERSHRWLAERQG